MPKTGIEPVSPRPQRGVLTTILLGPILQAQRAQYDANERMLFPLLLLTTTMEDAGAGFVDPQFEDLRRVFRENFEQGLEKAGASFAVFHKGKLLVDLYGGIANERIGQKWTEHSISVLFSTTKSISATVLATVMDRKGLSYDTKVVDIWPEFGRNGKENTTINHIVLHQAGIPFTDRNITREDVKDWRRMSEYFEAATPIWAPGTKTGYHALTIGFLIDQIIRRLDDRKRGVVDIFREEIVEKHGIKDVFIGIPSSCVNNRVAVLRQTTEEDFLAEERDNHEAFRRYMAYNRDYNNKLYSTWSWITTDDYNSLENRLLPMPSNMGIGNARSLAHVHSFLANKSLLSEEFYEKKLLSPVLEEEMDVVNGYPESKGCGYQFTKSPKGQWIFGHSGFGGQNVRVDIHENLSYAYVTNDLKVADADLVRPWKRLVERLYQLL